ncbi:MAG: exosortase-associated EpsI family protein [Phycisphaerae bacterium]|nr:exosortase-associated EpsI family protein [Phycisphaerae bacterium]
MSVVEFFSQPVWHRLSLTLVHFLWQGLAAAMLACVSVRLLRLQRGNPRYAAYLVVFVATAACPLITFAVLDAPSQSVATPANPSPVIESATPDPLVASITPVQSQGGNPVIGTPLAHRPLHERLDSILQASLPWAMLCWMGGVLVLSVRLLLGFIGVCRWRRSAEPPASELTTRIRVLSERLGMAGFSRVFISQRAMEAAAMGCLHPIVLLPAALATRMPPEMLEAVIAHELAHIRRLDLWVNLAQRVVETLLFYHPAVWWLSSRLRSERELCCDELAVKATGERLTYASALESAGRIHLALTRPTLALRFGQDGKPTLSRVRHILGFPATPPDSRAWLAGAIVVALLAVLAIPPFSAWTGGAEKEPAIRKTDQTLALPAPLSQFPRTLNGWTGEDLHLPAAVREYMRDKATDDFINRRYVNRATQQSADLYVAYSSSHPSGVLSQSPLRCFPANGWIWDQTAPLNIVTSSNRLIRVAVHRFHPLSSPPTELAVLCVYIVDNRIVTEQDLLERFAEETPQHQLRYVAQIEISSFRGDSVRSAAGAMLDALLETFAVRSPATEPGADDSGGESQESGSPPQTFNSSMVFDVFAQKSFSHVPDMDSGEMGSGPRWIGRTPSASPTEIPAGWIWWVLPSVPVDNWDALIEEMDHSGVPGLKLPLATDSDMEHLANLARLKYLDLISPRITDVGLAHLKNLSELQWLTLQAGAGVTDAGLANLAGMTKLRILVLGNIQVTDAGLAHLKGLTALQALSVQGAPISDAGLRNLQGLSKLQFLDLLGTQITDNGVALLTHLPELQVLLLGSAKITGPGLAHLKGMPRLRGLVLAGTQVTDASLASLADLPGLQGLTLSGTQITDAGIAHLQGLTGLRVLELENTRITDAGLAYLQGLTELTWLNLTSDKITDAGLGQLESLTGLKHLSTRGKQITLAGEQRLKQGLPNLTRD